jgi:hypothetical protein
VIFPPEIRFFSKNLNLVSGERNRIIYAHKLFSTTPSTLMP